MKYVTLGDYLLKLFKENGKELEHCEEFKDLLKLYSKDLLRTTLRKALAKEKELENKIPKRVTIP
jgi:hypothetical protein